MSRKFIGPLLFVAALAAVWSWPTSRHFLLGRYFNNLGVLYGTGIGVRRDAAEAVRWYRRAAEYGAPAAEFNLAFALQRGDGVLPDEHGAALWYERAANHGNAEAANNLGLLYANPTSGEPNLVLARLWLKRALPLADHELAGTIRENLEAMEKDMTDAELAASNDPATGASVATIAHEVAKQPVPPADEKLPPEPKVKAALESAAPMRDAVTRFVAHRHHLPTRTEAAAEQTFAPIDTPQAHVAVGNGGAVEVTIRGGVLNGDVLSFIPMLRSGQLLWICAKGKVPLKYVGSSC
ncbi:MAG: SEL1-like repeat protein [Proteobacteria bacterium]|nr:SEL1-like repeat protein [Pseudomonadota bacterium]